MISKSKTHPVSLSVLVFVATDLTRDREIWATGSSHKAQPSTAEPQRNPIQVNSSLWTGNSEQGKTYSDLISGSCRSHHNVFSLYNEKGGKYLACRIWVSLNFKTLPINLIIFVTLEWTAYKKKSLNHLLSHPDAVCFFFCPQISFQVIKRSEKLQQKKQFSYMQLNTDNKSPPILQDLDDIFITTHSLYFY